MKIKTISVYLGVVAVLIGIVTAGVNSLKSVVRSEIKPLNSEFKNLNFRLDNINSKLQTIKTNDLHHIHELIQINDHDIRALRKEVHTDFKKIYEVIIDEKRND